mmetsp:Transcript_16382/g.57330  ORF Transcript_16382/g.57330 Transcript_16382/m.57330 type:complete len:222 (-) Transcript_16382:1767-2432(-)
MSAARTARRRHRGSACVWPATHARARRLCSGDGRSVRRAATWPARRLWGRRPTRARARSAWTVTCCARASTTPTCAARACSSSCGTSPATPSTCLCMPPSSRAVASTRSSSAWRSITARPTRARRKCGDGCSKSWTTPPRRRSARLRPRSWSSWAATSTASPTPPTLRRACGACTTSWPTRCRPAGRSWPMSSTTCLGGCSTHVANAATWRPFIWSACATR